MRSNISLGRGEQVTATGVSNYPFTFPIENEEDIAVYLAGTRLDRGFDYSIAGAGTDEGFTVQLVNEPSAGQNLIALLEVPIQQLLDLVRGGGIPAEAVEDKLDLIIEMLQMFAERWQRTIRLSDYSLDEEIIAPDYVADKWWKYDATQRKIVLVDPPSGAQGLQGPAGPGILFGSGAPSGSLGSLNATYVDLATFDVYSKTGATTWEIQGNVKGVKGDPGDDGVSTTVGAAQGFISVANGDFAADAMSATVNLASFALADTNFTFTAVFSWKTDFSVTINSSTQVTLDWASLAPSDGVIRFILVAQGDLGSGGSSSTAHDHTSASGDGGVLTRAEFDQYTEHNSVSEPASTVPANKSRVWFDTSVMRWLQKVGSTVSPLGYYAHSHSTATNDGGTMTSPRIENYIDLKQISAPSNPAATYHRIYRDSSDSHLKIRNNAGTVVDLESATVGTSVGTYGVRGLLGTNDGFSPNTQFVFTADAWLVRNASNQITVLHAIGSKTLDIAVFAANGRDQSGAFAPSNWIYVYGIWNGATSAVLASLTAPPTGPTLPSGYTFWNVLTVLRIDASGNLIACRVRGPQVFYNTPQTILTDGDSDTSAAISLSSYVPSKAADYTLVTNINDVGTGNYVDIRLVTGGPAYRTFNHAGDHSTIVPYVSTSLYYIRTNPDVGVATKLDAAIGGYSIPNDG